MAGAVNSEKEGRKERVIELHECAWSTRISTSDAALRCLLTSFQSSTPSSRRQYGINGSLGAPYHSYCYIGSKSFSARAMVGRVWYTVELKRLTQMNIMNIMIIHIGLTYNIKTLYTKILAAVVNRVDGVYGRLFVMIAYDVSIRGRLTIYLLISKT